MLHHPLGFNDVGGDKLQFDCGGVTGDRNIPSWMGLDREILAVLFFLLIVPNLFEYGATWKRPLHVEIYESHEHLWPRHV